MIKEDILKQEYTEIADLAIRMENNVKEAITLYNEVKRLNNMKLVEDNLFNLQFVINWQDELNKVSITNVEDC
ncbi:MAG: hypothetical protein [phage Lak_Megaphage_RVC_AP4_GC26]|jgi:hypothetical protein|uniref:Uncharacterized protein n=2 Tax=Caudoviricetes code 15 clade TaxID=3068822 RepID=A0ABZ0Z4H6_9CAUD|nr:MAG: hypothetical protein [phage Lak_Megaphage_RVC_AP3_GC26]WQJ52329.1 MAG: hypothetical protein [phage Lak_Megaphage_RVC_AP4_GC26]WQJ54066.1 MAG: hypothetical protein [phage Lak_Megaphage_RVC_AP1_GC26]